MLDREKVTRGLECCIPMTFGNGLADCENCPYDRKITIDGGITECCHDLMADALALVKAQEPVKPRERIYHFFADRSCYDVSPRMVTCGACGECLPTGDATTKYCPTCGRPVKWND